MTLIELFGLSVSGRIYKCLFTGSVSSLLTLPLDMLSTWVMIPLAWKIILNSLKAKLIESLYGFTYLFF